GDRAARPGPSGAGRVLGAQPRTLDLHPPALIGPGQTGSLRNTGRGRCRSTVMTHRIGPGAHACSLRPRTAVTITSPTCSGVGDRGAAFRPSFIRVRPKPGRITVTVPREGRSASVRPV